jgi:hypothetical protein
MFGASSKPLLLLQSPQSFAPGFAPELLGFPVTDRVLDKPYICCSALDRRTIRDHATSMQLAAFSPHAGDWNTYISFNRAPAQTKRICVFAIA